MRVKLLAVAAIVLVLSGCALDARPQAVPDLRGERLDVAERRLEDVGLEYERVGGGAFGIIVRSNWRVCEQEPAPGLRAERVRLVVARECVPERPPSPPVVPDVLGWELDEATEELAALGIDYDVESLSGEQPLAEPLWEVCEQEPAGGARAWLVELYVERDCSY